jgi:hypothetical protein
MPVLHNTASPMEQQQQQPQTVSMQHASEQPGVQQPQPPLQTALDHHASEQQIMQQQDAGQLPEHPPEDTKQQAPAWQSYSSVFTAAKAGMGGVDQAKVKQVVYDMSKVIWSPHARMHARMGDAQVPLDKADTLAVLCLQNSAHFANEQRKQAQTDARIARLKAQAAQLTPAQLAAYQK